MKGRDFNRFSNVHFYFALKPKRNQKTSVFSRGMSIWGNDSSIGGSAAEAAEAASATAASPTAPPAAPPARFPVYSSFDEMGLHDTLLRGIYSYGFEKPSRIQSEAIAPIVAGKDVLAQAQSGTGKTAAFTISILQRLLADGKGQRMRRGCCRAMVLAPTRELAAQIVGVMTDIGSYTGLGVVMCVGGTSVRENARSLFAGVDVVVGTPGRVFDLISRGSLVMTACRIFCLDEADEMLSRGFQQQVQDIFRYLPEDDGALQCCLFSATMPPDVQAVSSLFMRAPHNILLRRDALTLEGIRQFYVAVDNSECKLDTLCDLYETLAITQAIIYCNTQRTVEWLAHELHLRDFTVASLHGDMPQSKRTAILEQFRSGLSRVLIATDLLARGIDVQQVSLVLNYDVSKNLENYIHRIGRSGRFGRKGVAVSFVTQTEASNLQDIARFYQTSIEEMPANISELV